MSTEQLAAVTTASSAPAQGSARPQAPGGFGHALMLALLLLVSLGAALPATAHELYLARFEIMHGAEPDSYQLQVILPARSAVPGEQSRLVWPEQCAVSDTSERLHGGQLRYDFTFQCAGGLQTGALLSTPWGQDGSVFTSRLRAGEPYTQVLAGRGGGVQLPLGRAEPVDRGTLEVGREYAGLGMFHILEGWDHLAFVLCLCLLVRGRALLVLVTAFTLGHSVSLALAYLGYLNVPMRPVEAVIALSVAFMAREALTTTARQVPGWGGWRYPAVVAGFGLLHGLGFASELEGLGVSTGERITGLLTFNLGVEIGQLLFVGIALTVFAAARQLEYRALAERGALAGAGILGMYWFIERLLEVLI